MLRVSGEISSGSTRVYIYIYYVRVRGHDVHKNETGRYGKKKIRLDNGTR